MVTNTQQIASVPEPEGALSQEQRYLSAVQLHGDALVRLARGYEAEPEHRKDLLQEVHVALWRSFATFDQRCSLRTWVYRVAHIAATRYVIGRRHLRLRELHTLDDVPEPPDAHDTEQALAHEDSCQRLMQLIQQLKPLDRQVILLYLEDFAGEAIAEMVGLRPENVATKIHRLKKLLTVMYHGAHRP